MGNGIQHWEVELSDEAAPTLPEFNATAMAQLEAMGFPAVRCQKALLATGNSDPEAAMEWLFAHMDDSNIDSPIQISSAPGGEGTAPEPDQSQVASIADMGFTIPQARKALRETVSILLKFDHLQLMI
jgi:ubiquitin carboxyl-terminal hydrolase 5/13